MFRWNTTALMPGATEVALGVPQKIFKDPGGRILWSGPLVRLRSHGAAIRVMPASSGPSGLKLSRGGWTLAVISSNKVRRHGRDGLLHNRPYLLGAKRLFQDSSSAIQRSLSSSQLGAMCGT